MIDSNIEHETTENTLAAGFAKISKLNTNELEPYLTTICNKQSIQDTKVLVNCHHIALDGSKLPRLADLTQALANWMIDYAIPRRALEKVQSEKANVQVRKTLELRRQAKESFKTKGMSGEQGEMLMFVIAEAILGLPQLLCKMDIKTDPQMHFHGLDGVHCGVSDQDNLAVYWCESKVHKDLSNAVSEALDGLKPFLLSAGTGGLDKKRELALLNRYMDLGDEFLQKLVLDSLDPANVKFNSISWRGICFVGFDSDFYPTEPNKKSQQDIANEINIQLEKWMKSVKRKSTNRGLESFDIHFVFVPFDFCEDFRAEMLKALEIS